MIRSATPSDVPVILDFIQQLADYEKLRDACHATTEALAATLFGPRPYAEALIAEDATGPVGFALFFHNYSTFLAKPGIYLEDLFVIPSARGAGHGKALLKSLARLAVERGCGRLEWSVLDWNAPSIAFYKSLGAQPQDEWTIFRLTGDALLQCSAGESNSKV
jgi:GNAT superfamily N-acetyltransferase